MTIKTSDIANKKFSTSFRGYNTEEVEDFRKIVCFEYEKLLRTNSELNERNQLLVNQLSRYKEIEAMLNKTLIVAQETADNVRQNAQNESQHIINEANINADRIVSSAIERAQVVSSELDAVVSQTKVFKAKFKIMLEEQMAIIDDEK